METIESAIRKIIAILPENTGISKGCIVDINNKKSEPMDIVFYEKGYCVTEGFFPCEHVIAAGIVKDIIDSDKTIELYEDIESVKILNRSLKNKELCRKYGSKEMTKVRDVWLGRTGQGDYFNQKKNQYAQIYTFVLCEKILNEERLLEKGTKIINEKPAWLLPNAIISLQKCLYLYKWYFQPADRSYGSTAIGGSDYKEIDTRRDGIFIANRIDTTNGFEYDGEGANFEYFLKKLQVHFNEGRTTDYLR
jgi:hypothetical protein